MRLMIGISIISCWRSRVLARRHFFHIVKNDIAINWKPADIIIEIMKTLSISHETTMAGFRPYSKIIGNFRKMENFCGHFIKHQKWRLQPNLECVGVFSSRDIAILNLKTSDRGNYPWKWLFPRSFVFIVKNTKSYISSTIFMKNYPSILEFS